MCMPLLPGGLAAIEQLLPGFQTELVAGGAVRCDSMQEIRFVASGREITRDAAPVTNVLASRPYIEGHLRRRVLGLPNVTLIDGTSVHGLVPSREGVRVIGVQLAGEILTCDLAVVATGRAGQLPAWLEILGYAAPAGEKLLVDIRYASRHYSIPDGYLGRDKLILIGAELGRPRGMGLFAQEDGAWLLTLVGYGPEHRPPTDDAGYLEFLASVAPADVLAGIIAAEPLDDLATHAFPASRRRRTSDSRCFRADCSRSGMRSAVSTRCMARACPSRPSRPSPSSRVSRRVRTASPSATSRRQYRRYRMGLRHRKRSCTPGGRRRTTAPYPAVERMGRAHSHRSRARPLRRGGLRQGNRLLAPPTVLVRPRFVWRVARSRTTREAATRNARPVIGTLRP
jgi:hypothetical protein